MSRFTIRPFSPDPCTEFRSIPFSFAIFLANGEANTRPFDSATEAAAGAGAGACAGVGVTGAGAGVGTSAAGAGVDAGAASSFASSAGAAASASLRIASTSSPFSPIIAKTAFTGAFPPFSTPMCSKTPSKNDSNSIVALSVSISARSSPEATSSPTCLCHSATTPSVMVSLNFGIKTISAISVLV